MLYLYNIISNGLNIMSHNQIKIDILFDKYDILFGPLLLCKTKLFFLLEKSQSYFYACPAFQVIPIAIGVIGKRVVRYR